MVLKSMPSVQSSPAQYSAVFPDVVRYAPKRDRYGVIVGWDLDNIREPYRKNFKSEEHYQRWKRWCEVNYTVGSLLHGKDYRAWLAELNLPTTVQKEELFNVLRFGYEWCKRNIAPKNIRIGFGQTVPMPEPEAEEDDFETHVDYV
jgi:hypothetical protein|tara:strand:+ start:491 stop:928 length:438 start_codon:yes stop_codon:yes gene_type:complete